MSDSNRVRIALFKDPTPTVALSSQRMRVVRATGEGMGYEPKVTNSKELRSDRMSSDPILVNVKHEGVPFKFELSFPPEGSAHSMAWESLLFNTWTNTPFRENDGVADAVITDIGTVANTVTFTTGPAFVIGHLVRLSGNANAANNTIARVTTGGATSFVATGGGFTAEAVPPGTSRLKVVGAEGVSADIAATATGLTCTTLNFTAIGIVPGMWLKIGGTAAITKFATAANNDWVRVVTVTATAITLDNLPVGWGADVGTAKTIRLFFGDRLINGVNQILLGQERAFLDQAVPTYILQRGFSYNQVTLNSPDEDVINGSFSAIGQRGADGIAANGATYDAAPDSGVYPPFAGNVHLARISEAGAAVAAPNFVKTFGISVTNNVRANTGQGTIGAVAMGAGSIDVSLDFMTYFGDRTLLQKLFAQTPSSFFARLQSALTGASQHAFLIGLPRIFYTGGNPTADAINTDVMLPLKASTSRDPVTNCEIDLQRVEYFEL